MKQLPNTTWKTMNQQAIPAGVQTLAMHNIKVVTY